jgi:hypothetical protein
MKTPIQLLLDDEYTIDNVTYVTVCYELFNMYRDLFIEVIVMRDTDGELIAYKMNNKYYTSAESLLRAILPHLQVTIGKSFREDENNIDI